jgi:hypothetical protein
MTWISSLAHMTLSILNSQFAVALRLAWDVTIVS